MENTNELKYAMDLKNFYWNIMISPRYRELVDMLETYLNLHDTYQALCRENYISKARETFDKVLELEFDIVDFIEENINLEKYELDRYNEDLYTKHALALLLINMYNDDI